MSDDKKPPVDSPSSAPSPRQRLPPTSDINELHARFRADPRFNPPTPSIWTRLALVVLVIILFWFGVNMRKEMARPPPEVQALRYSNEFQYRPAASPVITETLADGQVPYLSLPALYPLTVP
ncbi:hypothetical protein BDY19DRAFT_905224 [Irpex rosettiformis]|uniref:Uncharacterized protein n=1 Tax=Irpex rosettiformis TaxID=378272 RepID=A0ACB8U7T1_9APHY|nr:hypothetical protein BDY19DRAFT_905224 [Irpex rosettiformis]